MPPRKSTEPAAEPKTHHVNVIPSLRFVDDLGNIYQLDPGGTRGIYTLRKVAE